MNTAEQTYAVYREHVRHAPLWSGLSVRTKEGWRDFCQVAGAGLGFSSSYEAYCEAVRGMSGGGAPQPCFAFLLNCRGDQARGWQEAYAAVAPLESARDGSS